MESLKDDLDIDIAVNIEITATSQPSQDRPTQLSEETEEVELAMTQDEMSMSAKMTSFELIQEESDLNMTIAANVEVATSSSQSFREKIKIEEVPIVEVVAEEKVESVKEDKINDAEDVISISSDESRKEDVEESKIMSPLEISDEKVEVVPEVEDKPAEATINKESVKMELEQVEKQEVKETDPEMKEKEAEISKKRVIEEELVPVLVRIPSDGPSCSTDSIQINKNQFKIGRKPDNDEVILSVWISRSHCIIHKEEKNHDWLVTNLSSTDTLINDRRIERNETEIIRDGDILQLSLSDSFKYKFTLVKKEKPVKKARHESQDNDSQLDDVLTKQRSFVQWQENERKDLEKQLVAKQEEQENLKQELEQLLEDQRVTKTCNEKLNNQIAELQAKIEVGNSTELSLQQKYRDLLQKLEEERVKFEERLAEEKLKWQEALKETKQEKERLELTIVERMEEWRERVEKGQQEEWQMKIDNLLQEEKSVQTKLQDEKRLLEQKLREMEEALKQKEATAAAAAAETAKQHQLQLQQHQQQLLLQQQQQQLQQQQQQRLIQQALVARVQGPIGIKKCVLVKVGNKHIIKKAPLLATVDLTKENDGPSTSNTNNNSKDSGVLDKVNNIMEEQLTCSICTELYVKATSLNCTHMFCQHCILTWVNVKKRTDCPTCRTQIINMTGSIVMDNLIEKMLESFTPEQLQKRKQLVDQRRMLSMPKMKTKVIVKRR